MTRVITNGIVTGYFTTPDLIEKRTAITISWAGIGEVSIDKCQSFVGDMIIVVETLKQWEQQYKQMQN